MGPRYTSPLDSAAFARLPGLVAAPDVLLRYLSELLQRADFAHLRVEPDRGEPYGRNILHRDALGEVMLATWSGLMPCAAHDHGQARGAVLIVAGGFEEVCYQLRDAQLVPTRTRALERGQVLSVEPGVLHAMFPRGPGLTLHIYAPGISGMRVFDAVRGVPVVVGDDHGAWLPREARRESPAGGEPARFESSRPS